MLLSHTLYWHSNKKRTVKAGSNVPPLAFSSMVYVEALVLVRVCLYLSGQLLVVERVQNYGEYRLGRYPLPWTPKEGVLIAEEWRPMDARNHDRGVASYCHEWEA
jgi:hypothetical protein